MTSKKKKIGLALSGGAVLGFAHLGAVKVLEENNIEFDIIAGTSVGSLVGAFLAAGFSTDVLFEMGRGLSWDHISSITIPKLGLLNSKALEQFIDDKLGRIDIKNLPKKYAAVGVNLTTGKEAIFTEGPVSEAVRASCAIPGIFTPLIKKTDVIVDGGVLNVLPTNVVQNLGADYIISVKLKPSIAPTKPPRNIIQILINSSMLAWSQLADHAPEGNTCIIPDLCGLNPHDFKQAEALYERGKSAALESIIKIKNDLKTQSIFSVFKSKQ